jgi:hypothetical protein
MRAVKGKRLRRFLEKSEAEFDVLPDAVHDDVFITDGDAGFGDAALDARQGFSLRHAARTPNLRGLRGRRPTRRRTKTPCVFDIE